MHLLSPSVLHFSIRSIDTDIQLTSALLQQLVILSLSIISWVEHEKASSIPLCVPFSLLMEIFFPFCTSSPHMSFDNVTILKIYFCFWFFNIFFSHLLPKWLSIKSSENLPISLWVNQSYYKFIKLSRSTEAVSLQESVNPVTVSTRVFTITAESMSPFCNISLITHSAIIVHSLIILPLRLFVKVQWTGAP